MPRAESVDEQHFDVVIVGAGVAGAMVGVLCSKAGLRCLLVDRQRFPRHKVCGCCVNDRAVRMLRRAGLEASLRQLHPVTTSSLAIRYRGRRLDLSMPQSVAVSRRVFDQWLIDEAVAAGCRFIDDVTASVEPLPSDDSRSKVGAGSNLANERIVELRSSSAPAIDANDKSETHPNIVSTASASTAVSRVFAKVVIVCDGLGHPSLHRLHDFKAVAKNGSRIGLGAVFPRTSDDDWIRSGEILMAVAAHGYAGIVEIENRQLNLASAIDPEHLQKSKSPLASLQAIFQSAGIPEPRQLAGATIKGTVPLTRTAEKITGHRLFLLGDSTGYVEPFTGEGMAWALTAATAVAPVVVDVVRDGWSDDRTASWQKTFRGIVGREQKICRLLSAALKRPWLLPPILTTCRLFPSLTRRLVGQINRVPEALDIL